MELDLQMVRSGLRRYMLSLAALFLCFLATAPAHIRAAGDETAGQGLQVSNLIIDLNAEKGRSYSLKITVTNVTAGALSVKPDVNDFSAKDESGTPRVILSPTDSDESSYSLRNWVSGLSSFDLKSKESKTLGFQVNVPGNASPGGHYGVIRLSGAPSRQAASQNVNLIASVGVLVLTRVEGTIEEKLLVEELFVTRKGKRTGIVDTPPLTIVTRVKNTGNVHVKPIGHVTIKNFFGKIVATLDFGDKNKNVLPDSTRRFEQELRSKWLFGRYTYAVEAAYGTSGQTLVAHSSFWVLPIKLSIFFAILCLVGFIFLRRGLRRYHARILRKAGHRNFRNK